MSKEIRDICLTVGSIGVISIFALFVCTLLTGLKLGKFAFTLLVLSLLLVAFGLSKKNRARIKGLFTTKSQLSS
jgi:hypothetical protein